MKEITAQQIEQHFSMREAILACEDALKAHAAGEAVVPLREKLSFPKGETLLMPAYLKNGGMGGFKVVSVFPENHLHGLPAVPADVFLLDTATGTLAARLEGTALTKLRTGAVQGLATNCLAKKDARSALLIGTGGQAMRQLEAMLTVRQLEHVAVYDLDALRCQAFVQECQSVFQGFDVEIVPAVSLEQAVRQADIITTVTTSKRPTFDGKWLTPGTHINGVGAFTPDMQELPIEAFARSTVRTIDTAEGVFAEAGDVLSAIAQDVVHTNDFVELGALLLEKERFRDSDEEITLFKTVGSAILDIVVAERIYQKLFQD
ncbi:ornithine cyclodeaminase family protein [Listeria costaricensis]|uniref:ornithine cyclodeaminase family protein n=1 Tax=Listeria costaricensis TaxID=2026604 RepID=UPI000C06AB81|nr:ornithine cyclodeaminase family protein [Listeria costaricensis]